MKVPQRQDATPRHTITGKIDFDIFFEDIICYDDSEYEATLLYIPVFPFCANDLKTIPAVWEFKSLVRSYIRPGGYELITCSCGEAEHAGITGCVYVSHPDNQRIVWEINISDFEPVLCSELQGKKGYIRFVFLREYYKKSLKSMYKTMKMLSDNFLYPHEIKPLTDTKWIDSIHSDTLISVECFGPYKDDIQELHKQILCLNQEINPLFSPGTTIEIGLFKEKLFQINGMTSNDWLGWYFTRLAVKEAFDSWMQTVCRRYSKKTKNALSAPHFMSVMGNEEPKRNEFVLRDSFTLEDCHRAGRHFVEVFAASLKEGNTAPGVNVQYVEICPQ
ncbi:MAG: hypothetical protein V8Q84_11210 [Bilophila sp.]